MTLGTHLGSITLETLLEHKNIDDLFNEAKAKLTTVRDYLRFGISVFNRHELFYGHGTTNVYDEVVYLILHSLSLPLDVLEPYLDAVILNSEAAVILERFKQRAVERIPAAYITKEAILQGYPFYVDERVIIPRSFIPEIILNNGLTPWIEHEELVHSVLDLCTGNGSIAVIAADYFYDSEVIASDIDADALAVAEINVKRHGLEERVSLIQSDLWLNLGAEKFDLILSNPPYVDQDRMNILSREYLYEPQHALSGGEGGLDLVVRILTEAKQYLTQCGVLVVEMGDNRDEIEALFPDLDFAWLETESGDGFVFVVTYAQLNECFA